MSEKWDFIVPDFVKENDPADIQERMMNNLPEDIDDMPGGFPFDFTMPTALEKSELIQYHLVRALMLMSPMWAWEDWLDLHGQQANIFRKPANKASGYVTIEGTAGTVIPTGYVVCTAATLDSPSIEFEIEKETIIPDEGVVIVAIMAIKAGKKSNVKSGTITLMQKPLKTVMSVYNEDDVLGGTETEDDESYRERILDKFALEASNIANDSDFRRWAKEVPGIGDCIVVPTWNGPGTVKLILIDSNGVPANDKLVNDVYNYIMSPDNPEERLMPTGSAKLTVVAAETKYISYSCADLLYESYTNVEKIRQEFAEEILKYYESAKKKGVIKYNMAHSILTNIAGVLDFENFRVNDGIENIVLEPEKYPETDKLDFR